MSRERFIKFVSTKARQDCEVCGASHWIIPEGTVTQRVVGLFMPRADDGGYVMPGSVAEAYLMVCQNCKHLRLFSKPLIDSATGDEE